MPTLTQFNRAYAAQAQQWISHCVALEPWQEYVIAQRPYKTLDTLYQTALDATANWQGVDLDLALSTHPRIGEQAEGKALEATTSRAEQSAVQQANQAIKYLIKQGNHQYEQRFQRIFLIRAKGRTPEQIVESLNYRLTLSDEDEREVSLQQLREITLLRLQEAIQ